MTFKVTALLFVLLAYYVRDALNQDLLKRVGKMQEVFAWSQLTYNIDGSLENPDDFIQYNNVPIGVERHQHRLFITVPRRRNGILSTLNYLDLTQDSRMKSPRLRPYPDYMRSRTLYSVYRTRVDECNRLWMVDTGRLEIPNQHRQMQPPAIVVFDLATDRQLFRYEFKSSDLPQERTPAGLISVTVDIQNNQCDDAYAYIPDLATYGLIVFSLKQNDSWRLSNSFFSFTPTATVLNIGGQRFQLNDGIFSIALTTTNARNCKTAYFHPLSSYQEFSVSTCDLKNRNFANDSKAWERYSLVGERGVDTQSTMHGYHPRSRVMFYAEVGRSAVSCWHTGQPLVPANVVVLAQDSRTMEYPSDLHVTGDEVWVMTNSMPRFIFSTLDTAEYNFHIYRGNVSDLIAGTVCEPQGPRRNQ